MGNKKEYIFIHNPFSGSKSHDLKRWVEKYAEESNAIAQIWDTTNAGDFTKFIAKAKEEEVDVIVSCGGDGTLNAISKEMVNSPIALGIVPLGSGNGLSRHLKLPLKTALAVKYIFNAEEKLIDTALINGNHFVNVAGVGFDGLISGKFAGIKKRGIKGYAKVISSELSLKQYNFEIECENGSWKGKSPMICFTNASQWGNNVQVYPNADLQDEILECVIFNTKNWVSMGYGILSRTAIKNGTAILLKGKKFKVVTDCPYYHFDGEPDELKQEEFEARIRKSKLKILC
jgi:YegS/Rv2252/BmrU family lipid kinase